MGEQIFQENVAEFPLDRSNNCANFAEIPRGRAKMVPKLASTGGGGAAKNAIGQYISKVLLMRRYRGKRLLQ